MAENVLGTLFGDIAKAIRGKTGDTATMKPAEFPEHISKIESSNVIDNVEISLDFANGDQTERLPEGYSANSVTIFKPENLAPENIAEGINIAGIIGTHSGGGGSVEGTATVTFCNYDGTELFSRLVFIGDDCADPVAQGKINTPTKASDVQYNYTFNGWSDTLGGSASSTALKNITADKTAYAGYKSSLVYYTVRFYDGDTLMQESQVAYGGTATPPDTTKEGYAFVGWTPNDLTITADTDFIGNWAESLVEVKEIEDDWETIIASVNDGTYGSKYKIGNYKPLNFQYGYGKTETINMQIVAFNVDERTDGGTAPITWIAMESIKDTTNVGMGMSTDTNWSSLSRRTSLNGSGVKPMLSVVNDAIVSVNKKTRTSTGGIETTEERIWIPSAREIGLTGTQVETSGLQYSYIYTDDNSRVKIPVGQTAGVRWELRSIYGKGTGVEVSAAGALSSHSLSGSPNFYVFSFCT